MIALYAQTRDWDLGNLSVDVEYDPDATPRRANIKVHLPKGLTADQLRRLRRVVDTCPAKRALETGFTFDEQFVIERAAAHA